MLVVSRAVKHFCIFIVVIKVAHTNNCRNNNNIVQIVGVDAVRGVDYRRGQICARGLVGHAARGATVFLRAHPATTKSALATPK